jgi:hypothetical protein
MVKVAERFVYKAFGFLITSGIPLPELSRMENKVDSIDIDIKIEDLSNLWSELSNSHNAPVINEKLVFFQVPNIATFLIQGGRSITVSPMGEYKEDVIRLYILGSCMGAILMQRRILPLHGSAVAIKGKAYAIIGDSGAGKSTLASAFLSRGFQLLTDDIIAVSLSKDNIPFVTPSYPQQKLWKESMAEFGMGINEYRPIYQRETKFAIPILTQFCSEPLPLAGAFELVKSENEKIEIVEIEKLARLRALLFHTFRNSIITNQGLMDWHFTNSTRIISQIDIYQLRRPTSGFTAYHLVDYILGSIKKEGIKC